MTNSTERPFNPTDDYEAAANLIDRRNRVWEDALHDAFPSFDPPLDPSMVAAWAQEIKEDHLESNINLDQELDNLQMRLDAALGTIDDLHAEIQDLHSTIDNLQSQIAELGGIDDPDA